MADWSSFEAEDKQNWDTIDHYLTDNTIDDNFRAREHTDYPALKLFIVRFKPQPPPPTRTLVDLLRYNPNQLNELLGYDIGDKGSIALAGQPLDQLIPAISPNELGKPLPRDSFNLIPRPMRSNSNYRLATLGSIGYGPKYRFYR